MSGDAPASPSVPERPATRSDLVFRELADEWVLFDPDGRRLHVMNLTAALVWSHCTGERSFEEIVSAVQEAFDDPPPADRVEADVRETLETFVGKGLLEEEP